MRYSPGEGSRTTGRGAAGVLVPWGCCGPDRRFVRRRELILPAAGPAAPLKVRVINVAGEASVDEVIQDMVWEADMCFGKPDMGQSMPWTLHIADTGALRLARSYRIVGIGGKPRSCDLAGGGQVADLPFNAYGP